MQTNLKLIAWRFEEYYRKTRIPLWVFDQNSNLIFTNFTTSALLNIMEDMLQKARAFRISHSIEGSYLDFDNPYEMYYTFNSDGGKHQFFTVIIGPTMTVKPSGDMWSDLTFGQNLFIEQKRILSNTLPVLSSEEFLLQVTDFFTDILEENPPKFNTTLEDQAAFQALDYMESTTSDPYYGHEEISKVEDLFNVFVINGSVYKLNSLFDDEEKMEILFPNKASYQDCVIRAIELLTIAKLSAIENGADKLLCQARFEKYRQQLKACRSYDKILHTLKKATLESARNSHKINTFVNDNYSPMTNKCIKRIVEKLPEKITLDELAGELHISAKYLSALFNKETGMSITDFMHSIRIDEAKRLLTETSLSYLEISNLLNFCSQSYFNNLFKKKEGMTPKEYREKNNSALRITMS